MIKKILKYTIALYFIHLNLKLFIHLRWTVRKSVHYYITNYFIIVDVTENEFH